MTVNSLVFIPTVDFYWLENSMKLFIPLKGCCLYYIPIFPSLKGSLVWLCKRLALFELLYMVWITCTKPIFYANVFQRQSYQTLSEAFFEINKIVVEILLMMDVFSIIILHVNICSNMLFFSQNPTCYSASTLFNLLRIILGITVLVYLLCLLFCGFSIDWYFLFPFLEMAIIRADIHSDGHCFICLFFSFFLIFFVVVAIF